MKTNRLSVSLLLILLFALIPQVVRSQHPPIASGKVQLAPAQLMPGQPISLTGDWLYKPGYLVKPDEQPQLATTLTDYVSVPVPQFLNRTQWWLDDSEDFKKFEEARLKKLGFDTERAEDGWYQLILNIPALPKRRRLFIEFDGVAMKSKTFCNGQLLGSHEGMFSRFAYDLTSNLKSGRNLISVFVSMEKIPTSALSLGQAVTVNLTASKILTLSKGMFGPLSPDQDNRSYDLHGIWQPVKLVVHNSAMLDDVWFIPSLDGARVQVEARSLAGKRSAVVRARWTDTRTNRLFAATVPVSLSLGEGKVTRDLVLRNVQPRLWTPANPSLYRLDVRLESAAGELLDSWSQKVGFRTFEKRGNKFYLNNKPYWLRGANQLPYGKNSWDPKLPRRLIQLLHDANIRVTRTHATPWNETWLDAADEIGLGVSIEGVRPWGLAGKIGPPPPEIFQHWLAENEDVIKRGRNHPSVLLWTIGNELLLRDDKNLDKWKLLSEVVKQTRRLDPMRPVVADSTYAREEKFYRDVLQPNGVDDGDVDDIHRYRGWYSDSPFVADSQIDTRNADPARPFMGQEVSTGYPDLDTGLPVLRYTRDLLTPQAWVGQDAYPGSDPAIFLEHDRAVTKRWAEQLRFQRRDRTAGFMLFSAECWFAHSYDASTVRPYPIYAAMREAWAPIGLALETGRRRFYSGEVIDTVAFITNDDEQFRDLRGLTLRAVFIDERTGKQVSAEEVGKIDRLPYYETAGRLFRLRIPQTDKSRQEMQLMLALYDSTGEISRTRDRVEVFAKPHGPSGSGSNVRAAMLSVGGDIRWLVNEAGVFRQASDDVPPDSEAAGSVLLIGGAEATKGLAKDSRLRGLVERGATAILFSPGQSIVELFPADVLEVRKVMGEYADYAPAAGTKLTEGLRAMDVKWWGRKDDWRVFVASSSHRLKPGGAARELIRFIPSHGYIPAERLPEQYQTVLFEIRLGKGRVWVCDLDLEESVRVDPAAHLVAINILRAAADPSSTNKLPVVPTHEASLAGRHKTVVK
ncbi:MAG: glycoside hydrolase family 2 TIM barrel-domain containing protein [bacterium]